MSPDTAHDSEQALVSKVRQGDADAFLELAARYLPLIRTKASSFSALETDDLCQEGLLGLLRAARTFDETAGAQFRTYAGVCISNQLVSAARGTMGERRIPKGSLFSLNDEGRIGEAGEASARERLDPEALVIERESFELARSRVQENLTALERSVFFLYLSGYRYAEIAKRLHISEKTADNAIQRVRRKIKKLF